MYMARLPLIATTLALLACISTGVIFVAGSKRIEALHREQADLARRVSTTESVYDVQDCVLSEDEGCDMGERGVVFLGDADKDGEVRWLRQVTKDGKEQRIGQLTKEETYVRMKHGDGSAEGYISDRYEGTVEIYVSQPTIQLELDERLPVIIRRLFMEERTEVL